MFIARLGAVCASALIVQPAQADGIERSCTAYYALHLSTINNEQGQWLYSIADVIGTGQENSFTARRGCGLTVPNRCRQRASEAAMQCMAAHAKNPAQAPAECRSDGVQNYSVGNLEQFAQTKACDFVRNRGKVNPGALPKGYTVKLTIKGKVYGDEGCGGGNRRDTSADLLPLTVSCTQ
jgi:hypothetical protein